MTFLLQANGIRAVVLDIEGTTTPMAFVSQVLFPLARTHVRDYLQRNASARDVREAIALLADEYRQDVAMNARPPEWREDAPVSVAPYVEWLMDRDRKSTGLKLLQGHVWEEAYRAGILKGEVFADVRPAFERWRRAGMTVAIYSSGSVLAQRLLFSTTREGDLVPFISAFFDTTVGPKISADSYREIARALRCATTEILFVSDTRAELDAARAAGCQALHCRRPNNREDTAGDALMIESFDEIV